MLKQKKGQVFVSLIGMILAIIIYIFAAPILYGIIQESLPGMGTATAFIVKLLMWMILIVLIAIFIQLLNSDQGFFVK